MIICTDGSFEEKPSLVGEISRYFQGIFSWDITSKMSKKFFLAKVGLLVFVAVFLVKWMKRFEGCSPLEKCVGNTFANDETGSGYLEEIEKSLRSSGLQSVIQDVDGRENVIEDMDMPPLKDNYKNISSIFSFPGEIQSEKFQDMTGQNGSTQKESFEDVFDSKKNEVKISDILTFPRRIRSSGFQDIIQNNAIRKSSKENAPSLKKEEKQKTNIKPFFRKTRKPKDDDPKRIEFEPEEDDMDERETEGDDDSEDDVTIYQPKRTSDCPENMDRYILRDLLSMWDQKAKKHEILYFLAYGSLLGYHRNGEVLPWDTDVDVFVESQSYSQIRDIAVPRNFKYKTDDKIARIVIQSDVRFPSENRTRVSCDGRIVPRSIDGCSFQDPIARVVRGNRHLDIFAVYHLNATFFYEPILKHYFEKSEFYPTKPCEFMGIKTTCPSNVPAVLIRKYGADFDVPAKICVDGQWEDRVR